MQFAGQRVDLDLNPVGEPHNFLITLSDDVLPDPYAILITGITPQKTRAEGLTEAEFLKIFHAEVATPETIFCGFNTVRFDDEFMRFLNYRNFYDAYEWQWKDGRSRWDLLDVVRMTRALRPDGIKWPFDAEGKPANRLELLASINKLSHDNAHDALSDVGATIALARLVKAKQPKLFEYLLKLRDKKEIARVVSANQPFVYTSGKYDNEFEKTTVVSVLAEHPGKKGVFVYDLRHDPAPFLEMSPKELAAAWRWQPDPDHLRLPVKTLLFNRCPAVAPLGVLDDASKQRLKIDMDIIQKNRKLIHNKMFLDNLLQAQKLLDKEQQARLFADERSVDAQLYDGFIPDSDKRLFPKLHTAKPETLSPETFSFNDSRLQHLLPLYKARNFPKSLDSEERAAWETHCNDVLMSGGENSRAALFFKRLEEASARTHLTDEQRFLLEELQLYGQSILPDAYA